MSCDKKSNKSFCEEDCSNYKSCFARSVAVNSQYKLTKYLDHERRKFEDMNLSEEDNHRIETLTTKSCEIVRLKKNSQEENGKLCTFFNGISRISSNRIPEIPLENMVHQSKVATLQWQLKEAEKSRAMYKDVMKEVVTFLERVHQSLDSLGGRINNKGTVSRSKSEHQIIEQENGLDQSDDYSTFRDFTWRRSKKKDERSEEFPEKLSQEAFRLLRTAQSLLNTQEPNLVHNIEEDNEFLNQLAREFPQTPVNKTPQRTTSFSLSPKLIMPDTDTRISTAFNRKLSLQLHETRQISKTYTICDRQTNLRDHQLSFVTTVDNLISGTEKSNSPPGSSISSVEAESGFSSMTSFQDVGLPKVDSNEDNVFLNDSSTDEQVENSANLWQRFDNASTNHKRWSSTPVKTKSNPIWV